MAGSISVRGLTDEQIEALKRLVKLFREQKKQKSDGPMRLTPEKTGEAFTLGSRRSDVIGKLTREEIYEER